MLMWTCSGQNVSLRFGQKVKVHQKIINIGPIIGGSLVIRMFPYNRIFIFWNAIATEMCYKDFNKLGSLNSRNAQKSENLQQHSFIWYKNCFGALDIVGTTLATTAGSEGDLHTLSSAYTQQTVDELGSLNHKSSRQTVLVISINPGRVSQPFRKLAGNHFVHQ